MTLPNVETALVESFNDRHLSRRERQSLGDLAAPLDADALARLREQAFQIVREALLLLGANEGTLINWLEEVVAILNPVQNASAHSASEPWAEAHFSPGDDCPRAIEQFLRRARTSVEICVFTITDDRLAEIILETHRRKIPVRIVTDNQKAEDLGSDIDRFEQAGIAVRVDRSPFHMHHKFALLDGKALLTGSYNWTRGAARDNEENLIITTDPRLIGPFQSTFERLWKALADTR